MNKPETSHRPPTPDEIAARAWQNYERAGRPEGRDLDHWLAAETQLLAERARPAPSATATARATPPPAPKPAPPGAALAPPAPRASTRPSAAPAR